MFHGDLAAALAAAGSAYAHAETTASNTLGALTATVETQFAAVLTGGAATITGVVTQAVNDRPAAVSLILGASGMRIPDAKYVATAYANYVSRNFTNSNLQVVSTPEG